MGMSSHVVGIKPPDEKWRKMKDVYDSCIKAGIGVPAEVDRFFGHDTPDEKGVIVPEATLVKSGALVRFNADMQDGFEVNIAMLPSDVKIIRFYNSY